MLGQIYIVERWIGEGDEEPSYGGAFCFDTKVEAEAFAAKMEQDDPDEVCMVFATDLFVHSDDAVKAARGE